MAAQSAVFAAGAAPTPDVLRAAHARLLRENGLQFSFDLAKPPPAPMQLNLPHWLLDVLQALGKAINSLGHVLGWVFIGGLAIALAIVVFFIGREVIRGRWPQLFRRKITPRRRPADWRPDGAAARALLEEADRLAAAGAYAEAVRLILHRSVEEIEGRRPRLVRPALTAREIAGLDDLPETARTTFAAIAAVVEASLFGGRPVDAAGFAECRRTYETFAFPGAWA